jgi:hypothetical protein
MSGYKQFHGLSGPALRQRAGPGGPPGLPQTPGIEDELEVLVEEGAWAS